MRAFLMLLLCGLMIHGSAQKDLPAKFRFTPEEDLPIQPIQIDVRNLHLNKDAVQLAVFLIQDSKSIQLPSQFSDPGNPVMWFQANQILEAGVSYEFEIRRTETTEPPDAFSLSRDQYDLTLSVEGKDILKYRHAMIQAPEGTNPLYRKKGAYIHPLYSPSGKILTNIQPSDHYHHYGIWAPWTRTIFQGRQIDFWNLADGQGTVRHGAFLSGWSGSLHTGFRAHLEHVDFTAPGEDLTVISEVLDVRASRIRLDKRDIWVVDNVIHLSCATDSMVELSQYRYGGGIGFRATPEWNRHNSTVLTSEGHTRKDADEKEARWCCVEGETGEGMRSGIVFMGHPSNWAFPEPMRVWPEDATQGTGELFFEFTPIRLKPWILYPGREYVLRYRMLVFDGALKKETIDALWEQYAHPPRIQIQKPH